MSIILLSLLCLIIAKALVEVVLASLNRQSIRQHAGAIPEPFKGVMDEATYKKSVAYSLCKSRFGELETVTQAAILGAIFYLGILPMLLHYSTAYLGTTLWGLSLMVIGVQLLLALPLLPLQWWSQFRIEARYGFNRSTQLLWWGDRLKGLVLIFLIGTPVVAALIAFYRAFPTTWWLLSAGAITLFKIVLMLLYPRLILPLFNKLSPLPEGPLRERLMSLADRAGFKANTIEVLDGSKRSSHSNAFFTGFGRFRRIVFFDTLLQQLSHEELEGVLAHEIGHYKRGHVLKHLVLSTVLTFVALGVMAWVLDEGSLFIALGFSGEDKVLWLPALLIMGGWFFELVLFWLNPLTNAYSRRHEYEADHFAKEAIQSPEPLIAALRKLHRENLSNLTPHPWFSTFYYSHPTLMEREATLRDRSANA